MASAPPIPREAGNVTFLHPAGALFDPAHSPRPPCQGNRGL